MASFLAWMLFAAAVNSQWSIHRLSGDRKWMPDLPFYLLAAEELFRITKI